MSKVRVLGAGLAGCEAGRWRAVNGVGMELVAQKPAPQTPPPKNPPPPRGPDAEKTFDLEVGSF